MTEAVPDAAGMAAIYCRRCGRAGKWAGRVIGLLTFFRKAVHSETGSELCADGRLIAPLDLSMTAVSVDEGWSVIQKDWGLRIATAAKEEATAPEGDLL
jgi:hypothetical protein